MTSATANRCLRTANRHDGTATTRDTVHAPLSAPCPLLRALPKSELTDTLIGTCHETRASVCVSCVQHESRGRKIRQIKKVQSNWRGSGGGTASPGRHQPPRTTTNHPGGGATRASNIREARWGGASARGVSPRATTGRRDN